MTEYRILVQYSVTESIRYFDIRLIEYYKDSPRFDIRWFDDSVQRIFSDSLMIRWFGDSVIRWFGDSIFEFAHRIIEYHRIFADSLMIRWFGDSVIRYSNSRTESSNITEYILISGVSRDTDKITESQVTESHLIFKVIKKLIRVSRDTADIRIFEYIRWFGDSVCAHRIFESSNHRIFETSPNHRILNLSESYRYSIYGIIESSNIESTFEYLSNSSVSLIMILSS
jgi:hypothetical protein